MQYCPDCSSFMDSVLTGVIDVYRCPRCGAVSRSDGVVIHGKPVKKEVWKFDSREIIEYNDVYRTFDTHLRIDF